MLYATGIRMLAGNAVNWSKLHKRLRDHNSKLINDSLFQFISTLHAEKTLPLEVMLAGSRIRNEWKNDSLYIALKDQNFKTPAELITPRKAERTIALAFLTLKDTERFLSVNGKLAQRDPSGVKKCLSPSTPTNWRQARLWHELRTCRCSFPPPCFPCSVARV